MSTTNLNIRIDKDVKENAENIFEKLGLSMTTAINVFLRSAIRVNGIPFELKLDIPNEKTKDAIEEGKKLMMDSDTTKYNSIESLKKALDE